MPAVPVSGSTGLSRRRARLAAVLAAGLMAACGGTESADSAEECASADLIAQCPPGSDPRLEASAVSKCEGSGSFSTGSADPESDLGLGAGLPEISGHVEGVCEGSGECRVYCQFQVPCECGVDRITSEGIFCTDCMETAACGNRVCEGTETPESCPQDCAAVCSAGESRCNGAKRQVCEGGHFTELDCAPDETCRADAVNGGATCQRSGI